MDHAKFWFRRHRLTSKSTFVFVLISICAVRAAAQSPANLTEPAVELPVEFEQYLDTVDSFSARFVQELWSDDQRLIEVAEGDVELQRPGRFRWHYDAPWEQLIVADGQTLWMYDVDIAQVTRSPLAANDPGNPGALLSGDRSVLDSFEVTGSGEEDGEVWVLLTPRALQSDYSSVRVAFARQDSESILRTLEFVDGLNQTTVIRFIDAEANPDIDPEHFTFEVPANAHVLGGPG